jgi:SNF2 family DNA or RNA helicase
MGIIRPPSPELVQWYLSRELETFDYFKDISEEELDATIQALDPRPEFRVPLFKHQKAMFLLGVQHSNFLFFAGLGAGKTSLTLNLIAYHKLAGRVKRALVLVPNLVLIQTWKDECAIHTPNLRITEVHGTKKERLKQLQTKRDVYVLNYAGLQSILSHTTGKRVIYPEDIVDFAKEFDFVGYDQITAVKNINSLTSKICSTLSKNVAYRYGLSGRPFGRHIEDLWAEFFAIDLGKTLGNNFYTFRSVFFKPKKKPWAIEWKFRDEFKDDLHRIIRNRSISYSREECTKLPPLNRPLIYVPFPEENREFTEATTEDLLNNIRLHEFGKAHASFTRMRQIASGFVYVRDDKGVKDQIVFKQNPKMDALVAKLQELEPTDKALVFHDFTFSGEQIVKSLDKAKIDNRWIYGGTPDKLKLQYLKDFKYDPDVQVLILNSASGAMGLNMQHASFMFFYESPVAPIIRDEAEGRIYRTGQKRVTYIYDLIVQDSIEERIMSLLKEGKDLFEELIQGKVDLEKEKWLTLKKS